MLQKKNLILLSILLFVSTLSCSVKPKDSLVCVEKDLDRARCVRILSGEVQEISEEKPYLHDGKAYTWYDMRIYSVILPWFSWVELKAFIIKICNKSKQCEQEVGKWDRSLQYVDDQLPQIPLKKP